MTSSAGDDAHNSRRLIREVLALSTYKRFAAEKERAVL